MEMEEVYYRVTKGLIDAVERSIFSAFNFPKLQAAGASGYCTFSRSAPSTEDITISTGTVVATEATDAADAIQFSVVTETILQAGQTSVNALVQAVESGSATSVAAGTVTQFMSQPTGIETVTNENAFTDGRDLETSDERRARFQTYVSNLARGTKGALTYAAQTVDACKSAQVIESPRVTCFRYDASAGSYTDLSNDINDANTARVDAFPVPVGVGDILYLGCPIKYDYVRFVLKDTPDPAHALAATWEYWNGSAWTALTASDSTLAMTCDGVVAFTPPSTWMATQVNNTDLLFWLRLRGTSAVTHNPRLEAIVMPPEPGTVRLIVADTGGLSSSTMLADVAAAVENYRGAGIRVDVEGPTLREIPITATLYVNYGYDADDIGDSVRTAIEAYLTAFPIGRALYFAELSQVAMNFEDAGVANIVFSTPTADVAASPDEILRPGTVTLTTVALTSD